eukprot:11702338-Alexandrium_andersonii.AAC.1
MTLGAGLVRVQELGGAVRDVPVPHQGPRPVHDRGDGERPALARWIGRGHVRGRCAGIHFFGQEDHAPKKDGAQATD